MEKINVKKLIAVLSLLIIVFIMVFACVKQEEQINEKVFLYEYNNATGNNEQESVTLQRDTFLDTALIVPQKEHFTFNGWYLDEDFNTVIADETGQIVISEEIFDGDDDKLYAKWTVNEKLTYKILMVYVTDIEATLVTNEGKSVNVNYNMSAVERQICEMTTVQMAKYLNEMLDGLVTFETESYFTTQTVGRDSFFIGSDQKSMTHYIMSDKILEVIEKIKNYNGTITTFGLNDYNNKLHIAAGYGGPKHASMHLESIFEQLKLENAPFESLLDLSNKRWDDIMQLYVHEFAHTVEQRIRVVKDMDNELHLTEAEYFNQFNHSNSSGLKVLSMYLRNKATLNGKTVGVPYKFWQGEVVDLKYSANEGGFIMQIDGKQPYSVLKGSDALAMEAVAFVGYRFIGWSDGVMTATRKDLNIQKNIDVTALFEPTK